jgi:hypothetical protein
MSAKSFYDLDYIIEINEHRFEHYVSAYQKVLERLTHIILIYSAITIYLVPIIQDVIFEKNTTWLYICFTLFSGLFLISLFHTVRLIMPAQIAYLEAPKKYYSDYRELYEQSTEDKREVEELLKGSYIRELEKAIRTNNQIFKRKNALYYNALIYSLLAIIPYVACIGSHILKKEDKIQKVHIVNFLKTH